MPRSPQAAGPRRAPRSRRHWPNTRLLVERAAQWCKVADDFVEKYGCPFLYAECRIYYGSILAAKGQWDDAERELGAGLRITDGACPGLHTKALIRLAALQVRQGRLEEAEQYLSELGAGVAADAEETLVLAALRLARSDAAAASRNLKQRLEPLAEHHILAKLNLRNRAEAAAYAVGVFGAFVPAFFAQWAPVLCKAAGVGSGQRLLDVACGTGIVACTAAGLIAPGGEVVGLDLNEARLTVARRVRPDIEFHQGNATALPFSDGSFDVVLCQLALMFFPDRRQALAEMGRVATAGGTVAVVVPGRLDAQAAFAPFVDMAARHAGTEAMSLLGTYFVCGDLDELAVLFESVGLRITSARTYEGLSGSVRRCLRDHRGREHPLIERISDEVYQRIRTDARDVLAPFTAASGSVEAPFECHVMAAQQR